MWSKGPTMEMVERLREELRGLLDAIHRTGGGVVFEEFPGALGVDPVGANARDGDTSKAHHALIQKANELAEVLAQFRSEEDRVARDHVVGFRQERGDVVKRWRPRAD